jgi:hypothetical protein
MAVSSSAVVRGTSEDILESGVSSQIAESAKTRFNSETLIDCSTDGVGVAGRPESLAKSADLCGFK